MTSMRHWLSSQIFLCSFLLTFKAIQRKEGIVLMAEKAKNENLSKARKAKNDEFYTQLSDIEKELRHYKKHFEGKTVFCNCDDPEKSNFWQYFSLNFEELKLKKLIATHYETTKQSYKLEMWKDEAGVHSGIKTLEQNGDFRSPESIALLQEADIVVTNPPFSLFREYVAQLMEHKKKFVILGNINAVTYKEIFPLIKNNKIWAGFSFNKTMIFTMPEHYKGDTRDENGNKIAKVPAIAWYTNLDIDKRHEDLILYRHYNSEDYPKYDNYDAINISKVTDIPCDYSGKMGVPITFLDKYNPDQFEIIGHEHDINGNGGEGIKEGQFEVNGKGTYKRIIIRKKDKNTNENRIETNIN